MSQDFNKVVRIGNSTDGQVFCKINFFDDKLSISGVQGPKHNGDCTGGCGQIRESILEVNDYAPGWNKLNSIQFLKVWNDYHLNDMQAGTPDQTKFLEEYRAAHPTEPSDYTYTCKILKVHNLLIDDGYEYGSGWLKIEVPEDALQFLMGLPETDVQPAWV